MAGALIKLHETTVSSVSSTDLGGTNWDASYNVYLVKLYDVKVDTDNENMRWRVLKASDNTADTSSNYDAATKTLRSDTTFNSGTSQGSTSWSLSNTGTGTHEYAASTIYLYNFNDADHHKFATQESIYLHSSNSTLFGQTGGNYHTVTQLCSGLNFFENGGATFSGTFVLYGLKK